MRGYMIKNARSSMQGMRKRYFNCLSVMPLRLFLLDPAVDVDIFKVLASLKNNRRVPGTGN